VSNDCWVQLLELLNKVCDHSQLENLLMRRNCGGRFGFGGFSVLSGSSGDLVSFYTTEGGGGQS
jgi:hypothetical protein